MFSPIEIPPNTAPPRRHRRRRRILAAALLVFLTAVASAAVAEAIAASSDAERYPATGRVVALPDGDMHLQCKGPQTDAAGPTVVLEAGLGEPGISFAPVQQALAEQVRVCSYDRPGYGWSEQRSRNWSAAVAAEELNELLTAAGESGPRLLVAHSIGGFIAREYALQHPENVVGVVLLDPTDTAFAQQTMTTGIAATQSRVAEALSRLGVFRAAGDRMIPALVGAQPPAALMSRLPGAYPADSFSASVEELNGSAHSATALEDAKAAEQTLYGSGMPLTVLSSAEANEETLAAHRRFASLSPNGQHQQVPSGGHYVHYGHPDLVVEAVLEMLARN